MLRWSAMVLKASPELWGAGRSSLQTVDVYPSYGLSTSSQHAGSSLGPTLWSWELRLKRKQTVLDFQQLQVE